MKLQGIIVGLILLLIIGGTIFANANVNEYEATVTEKEVKRSGDDDMYLVFAEMDDESVKVFKNTDSLLRFKFNSSNVQANIKVGKTYKFRVVGFRIGLFSSYQNIIEVTELE